MNDTTPDIAAIDTDINTVKQLQRAIAAADIARDILCAGIPAYAAKQHYAAIDKAASLKQAMIDMQREVMDRLPEGSREWVATGSRVGADHLRNFLA